MTEKMDLSVVIVSYNTSELTLQSIDSTFRELASSKLEGEVIVIDNASLDHSTGNIKQKFPNVRLIENQENVGFAKANNQAGVIARGKYLLFLNSDAELRPGALKTMHQFLEDYPHVGIASCQLVNPDGSIQPQGGWLPRLSTVAVWAWFLDDLPLLRQFLPSYQFRHPRFFTGTAKNIGWVGGTVMWIRRDAWNELEGFDESLFMYGEDVDLCYRARKREWRVMINPDARVVHRGRASAKDASWIKREVIGLRHIFKKHKPSWEIPLLRFILKTGMAARWVIFGILKNDAARRTGYAEAYRAS